MLLLFALIIVLTVWHILPRTVFSYPLEKLVAVVFPNFRWGGTFNAHSQLSQNEAALIYFVGYILLVCFLLRYGYHCFVYRKGVKTVAHFTDAFALFIMLFLLDFFLSTTSLYPFAELLWIFSTFLSYLLLVQFAEDRGALRLIYLLLLAIAQQCIYAIVYYILDIEQFSTPFFGSRTSGTLGNPSKLYPLCLIGIPLSLVLAETETQRHWRWFWRGMGLVMLLALALTYSRAGWLAIAVSLGYLAFSPTSPLRSQPLKRWLLSAFIIAALLGTAFVRTKGNLIGNPDDRSFWGRIAIWQTALKVIADHPLLGNGLNSYLQKQREHMTERLASFNPMNLEAKNLFLHIAAELGLIGLAVLGLVAWCYYQLYRFALRFFNPSSEPYAIAVGIHAALLGIIVAGLADTPILHHSRSATNFSVALLLGTLCVLVDRSHPALPLKATVLLQRRRHFWKAMAFFFALLSPFVAYLSWQAAMGIKLALSALPKVKTLVAYHPSAIVFVPLKDIAPVMQDAVVASEDG